jgi:hypothetical protein
MTDLGSIGTLRRARETIARLTEELTNKDRELCNKTQVMDIYIAELAKLRALLAAKERIEERVALANLVRDFSEALLEKLVASEEKYGWNGGWKEEGWMDECRSRLREHLEKGDPRDVAAYCAFLWHHKERTQKESKTMPTSFLEDAVKAEPCSGAFAVADTSIACDLCDVSRDEGHP